MRTTHMNLRTGLVRIAGTALSIALALALIAPAV